MQVGITTNNVATNLYNEISNSSLIMHAHRLQHQGTCYILREPPSSFLSLNIKKYRPLITSLDSRLSRLRAFPSGH
ncbi:hypothetical protein L3X38_004540 [Prunus dulcis]|uniref:Uncharacterized protein n=1 Tax=Prunus dulcis TaxID=3755 RepID=A0AAD5F3A5_PRUDU|nr:hypothetical protein L3X38_004540 [Prunus dulcis]